SGQPGGSPRPLVAAPPDRFRQGVIGAVGKGIPVNDQQRAPHASPRHGCLRARMRRLFRWWRPPPVGERAAVAARMLLLGTLAARRRVRRRRPPPVATSGALGVTVHIEAFLAVLPVGAELPPLRASPAVAVCLAAAQENPDGAFRRPASIR